jgi:pimeloyl-ACP methyl ester carboxylesterase
VEIGARSYCKGSRENEMTINKATVLIVEDDDYKFARAKQAITDTGVGDVQILREITSHGAYLWMRDNYCDLLVLDLCVPRRNGESPIMEAGPQLLEKVFRKDSQCQLPGRVIGLSANAEAIAEYTDFFVREGIVLATYSNKSADWEETISTTLKQLVISDSRRARGLVIPLHGIRTIADWHRTLADVAFRASWWCPVSGWWYGRFSIFQFLSPFSRRAKILWFRDRYTRALDENADILGKNGRPSIVAHSFGTFILGNALLRYQDIRVDKVILCGCILPTNFPWKELIDNGQINAVLNCVGVEDYWPIMSSLVIPGTGQSGRIGFTTKHESVFEKRANLSHSEFFDSRQMKNQWMPFLERSFEKVISSEAKHIPIPKGDHVILAPILSILVWLIGVVVGSLVLYGIAFFYLRLFETIIHFLNQGFDRLGFTGVSDGLTFGQSAISKVF